MIIPRRTTTHNQTEARTMTSKTLLSKMAAGSKLVFDHDGEAFMLNGREVEAEVVFELEDAGSIRRLETIGQVIGVGATTPFEVVAR